MSNHHSSSLPQPQELENDTLEEEEGVDKKLIKMYFSEQVLVMRLPCLSLDFDKTY